MNAAHEQLDPDTRAFILDLEALTRKYGLAVAGCGCCGSPWLESVKKDAPPEAGYISGQLKWIDPRDSVTRPEELASVVRSEA